MPVNILMHLPYSSKKKEILSSSMVLIEEECSFLWSQRNQRKSLKFQIYPLNRKWFVLNVGKRYWLGIASHEMYKYYFIDINQFIMMKMHKGHLNENKQESNGSVDSSEEE